MLGDVVSLGACGVQAPYCPHLPNYTQLSLRMGAMECAFHVLVEQPVCPIVSLVSLQRIRQGLVLCTSCIKNGEQATKL